MKRDPFDFLPSFCWTPCQNLYIINRYWTTFETLAEIERLQRTTLHKQVLTKCVPLKNISYI